MYGQSTANERLTVVLPVGATIAIERAAIQARVTPSELMRRALGDGLRARVLQLANSDNAAEKF